MDSMRRVLCFLFIVVLASCRSAPIDSVGATRADNIEQSPGRDALLLLLEDQKIFDAYTVEGALQGNAGLRSRLALTLGRLADPRSCSTLEELLVDSAVEVQRAAAFGLGLLKDSSCTEGLLSRLGGTARHQRVPRT